MNLTTSVIALCAQAKELEDRGDFEGAWALIVDDLNQLDSLTPLAQPHILLRAGTIASRTGFIDREQAKDWLSRSRDLFERMGNQAGVGAAYFGLAVNCRFAGLYSEAYIWLDMAGRENPDAEMLCRIALLRGIVTKDEGKTAEALNVYIAIAPQFEQLENHNLKARYHGELAITRRKLATAERRPELYDLALIDYAAASYHHEQAEDRRSAAIVKNNAAFLLFKLGRYEDALSEVNDAIAIYLGVKDRPNLAQARETKAQILLALNRPEDAEVEARLSCDLLKIGGERAQLVESQITHGRCLARLHQKMRAFQAFQVAQDVAEFIEFNHGLGLVSLSILEELPDINIDTRRLHHKIVREKLDLARDAELKNRHAECIRITGEMLLAELGAGMEPESIFQDGFSLDETVLAFERRCIELALEEAHGCQKEAARLLGISASNLNSKLKNQHKPAKRLQTYGHYRGAKPVSHIDVQDMPNDALSGLGLFEGDKLVLKSGCRVRVGDVAVIRSRGKLYVGIFGEGEEEGDALLAPSNLEYQTWCFEEGTFEVVSKVVGYIRRDDAGKPGAEVHDLTNVSSEARLPVS